MFPQIDVQQLRDDYPLDKIVGQDVVLHGKGTELRGPCPFCKTGDDRLAVFIDDQTFNCRVCHAHGDVVQYVAQREKLDFVKAAYFLTGQEIAKADQKGKLESRSRHSEPLSGDLFWEWSNKLENMANQALYHLVEQRCKGAAGAVRWLNQRGIDQKLIEQHGIGYNDKWREIVPGYKFPPGVTLPRWDHDVTIRACNVYLSKEARQTTNCRRQFARGSNAKVFFNEWRIPYAKDIIIVEGELDCVLLSKFLSPFALAVTTGGSSTVPDNLDLLKGRRVIISLDNDESGVKGAEKWLERLPGAVVATVPAGAKDITDAWRQGVKLDEWIGKYL